jgi:histone acetyltransferase (RNA polymerase elongator complex component)
MKNIDRIDNKGNIREHITQDDLRTLCGLPLVGMMTQIPCDNGLCRRCERVRNVKLGASK